MLNFIQTFSLKNYRQKWGIKTREFWGGECPVAKKNCHLFSLRYAERYMVHLEDLRLPDQDCPSFGLLTINHIEKAAALVEKLSTSRHQIVVL